MGTERYVLLPGLGAVWAMGATCRVSTAPPPDQEVMSIYSSTVSLSSAPLLSLREEPRLSFQGQGLHTESGTPVTHQQQQWPLLVAEMAAIPGPSLKILCGRAVQESAGSQNEHNSTA